MRSLSFFLALFASAAAVYAQPKPIQARLQKTTVYLQGANLYYSENVSLNAGTTELVFENISPGILQNTLQAGTTEGFVMDVKYRLTYTEAPKPATKKYDRQIKEVLDSLDDIAYQIQDNRNAASVTAKEKEVLLNNPLMSGKSSKDSLELLKATLVYLKEKLNTILKDELRLDKAHAKLLKKQSDLTERYNALVLLQNGAQNAGSQAKPVQQVVVTVFSENASAAKINFSYMVQDASWAPHYELTTRSDEKTMDIHYFGYVTQNSGLDWKEVPITLSTYNPNQGNTKPELNPWYLSYIQYQSDVMSNRKYPMADQKITFTDKAEVEDLSKDLQKYVTVADNLLRTEYKIDLKYDIPSGADQHKIMINKKEIPIGLEFAAVPKLANDAFLLATVTGWEEMNIIPGPARLYFDGSYVGETYLDANTTSDTLKLNLGRDQKITMTRKKVKEKYSTKLIGGEKVETRTIELVVRNTNSQDIDLVLEDQIPVAQASEDIKIRLINSDDAELNAPTGKLSWKLKLKPKETRKILFTYEVKYPGDKVVYGL